MVPLAYNVETSRSIHGLLASLPYLVNSQWEAHLKGREGEHCLRNDTRVCSLTSDSYAHTGLHKNIHTPKLYFSLIQNPLRYVYIKGLGPLSR